MAVDTRYSILQVSAARRLRSTEKLTGHAAIIPSPPFFEYLHYSLARLGRPRLELLGRKERQKGASCFYTFHDLGVLRDQQLGEGAPVFRLAIKAPVDRTITCKSLAGEGILTTKLALSPDDWQDLQFARICGQKARNIATAVLAEMNGLFSPPVQYGGVVQGGLVVLALGTEHMLRS